MPLSKYKWQKNSAERIFANRNDEIKIFNELLLNYLEDESLLKILVYFGHGGIGKSRLLKKLFYDKLKNYEDFKIIKVFIDLGLKGLDDQIESLWLIRKQLKFKCILFDSALSYYWNYTNPTKIDTNIKNLFNQNHYTDIIDTATSNIIGFPIIKITNTLIELSNDILKKYNFNNKGLIKELKKLVEQPNELYQRLPYYLGLDIEFYLRNNESNKRFILFIDTYEQYYEDGTNTKSEWIREFVGSLGLGLIVITGRDKLNWEKIEPEWRRHFVYKLLKRLSNDDSKKFLNFLPIKQTSIINQMIMSSKGIPFYLDRLVDIYEQKMLRNEKIYTDDFRISPEQIIPVFLNHLDENEKYLVRSLSVIGIFNEELIYHISRDVNINFPIIKLKAFLERTFIEKINNGINLLRLHEILRESLVNSVDKSTAKAILNSALTFIKAKGIFILEQNEIFYLFLSFIDSILKTDNYNEIEIIESYLDIGLFLIDKGYWYELDRNIKDKTNIYNSSLKIALLFIFSLSIRKTKSIEKGLTLLNSIEKESKLLGKHLNSFYSERAYLNSINGNYKFAESELVRLYKTLKQKDNQERYYARIVEYYSDILFLTGKFKNSLLITNEVENSLDKTQKDNLSINYRVKGHIYRFNMLLEKAEFYYYKAYQIIQKNKYLEGRLYTNFAETLCYFFPNDAIEWAEKAIENNSNLNSEIEVGKAYTAYSISNIVLGNYKLAESNIKNARKCHTKIGYRAGLVFNDIALFFLELAANNNRKKLLNIFNSVQNQLIEFNVYQYLLLPMLLYFKEEKMIEDFSKRYEWIDFNETKSNIEKFLSIIIKS